jgi:hypothetical protein
MLGKSFMREQREQTCQLMSELVNHEFDNSLIVVVLEGSNRPDLNIEKVICLLGPLDEEFYRSDDVFDTFH